MADEIRISGVVFDSIVDGSGMRMTVFTQGCPHNCEGCHNPQTHDFAGGYMEKTDELYRKLIENPLQCGVTVSGGEPFCQAEKLIDFCRKVRESGKNVWIYSGYTWSELCADNAPLGAMELLKNCDVLVDGRFELAQKDLELTFRGSANQRIIDVQNTFAQGEIVTLGEH